MPLYCKGIRGSINEFLGIGLIIANFQTEGIILVSYSVLYSAVGR